jgi:beta-N-acetylhexosaminidase
MPRARRARTRRLAAAGRAIALSIALLVAACQTVFPRERQRRPTPPPDLGGLVLAGFHGTEAQGNRDLEELLCRVKVGGIILFARNITDAGQIARLTREATEMSRACTGRPLLIATDAEGGQVMRLGPSAGYTPTPSHQDLGDANDLAMTELEARRIGRMLHEAGINWNLAPVVDVGYNPANSVIVRSARSFGAGPALVTNHARAYIRGMHAEGILTALKHFPGHGSSFADSHLGFVDVTETANRDVEMLPYRALIGEGLADSVMTAHVFNRHLDARYPATLSSKTIRRLLRQTLRFDGVVVSDDLRMGAIEKHYGLSEAVVMAVRADVDLLLIGSDRLPDGSSAAQTTVAALRAALAAGRLEAKRVSTALRRVDALRERVRVTRLAD